MKCKKKMKEKHGLLVVVFKVLFVVLVRLGINYVNVMPEWFNFMVFLRYKKNGNVLFILQDV